MRFANVFVLFILVLLSSACASTRMQSPKQHRHLEASGNFAVDMPGFFRIPRVDAQLTMGLFDVMDVSAHTGTTGVSHYAGAGTRFYPMSWLTLGGQLEYQHGPFISFDEDYEDVDMFRGVLRPSFVYYGKHGGLYIGPQLITHHVSFIPEENLTMVTLGLFLGGEYKFGGFGAVQLELSTSRVPLYNSLASSENADHRRFSNAYLALHSIQMGIGFTLYFQELAAAVKSL